MIRQSVNEAINQQIADGELEESWLGDKWNQAKTAYQTFTNRDEKDSLSDRWARTKKNWNFQGELNYFQSLRDQLSKYLDAGQIANRIAQISNRGGKAS